MKTVTYKYDIGEKVKTTETGHPATVVGLMTDELGPEYRIVYWADSKRCNEWVFEFEITPR